MFNFYTVVVAPEAETDRDWSTSPQYQKYKEEYPRLLGSTTTAVGVAAIAAVLGA